MKQYGTQGTQLWERHAELIFKGQVFRVQSYHLTAQTCHLQLVWDVGAWLPHVPAEQECQGHKEEQPQSGLTVRQISQQHKGWMLTSNSPTATFWLSSAKWTKHRKWDSNVPTKASLTLTPPRHQLHYFTAPLFLHQKFPWACCWPGCHAWVAL